MARARVFHQTLGHFASAANAADAPRADVKTHRPPDGRTSELPAAIQSPDLVLSEVSSRVPAAS